MKLENVKESFKKRAKNVYFWIGLLGTFLLAGGVEPSTLTSWSKLGDAFISILSNPYMLIYALMSTVGSFVDPTTPGLKDGVWEDEYIDI